MSSSYLLCLTIVTMNIKRCNPLYPCHYFFLQRTELCTTTIFVSYKWFQIVNCCSNTQSESLLWKGATFSSRIAVSILLKTVKNLNHSKYITQICETYLLAYYLCCKRYSRYVNLQCPSRIVYAKGQKSFGSHCDGSYQGFCNGRMTIRYIITVIFLTANWVKSAVVT